ncbi:unnamed protein product [Linum tenue]|uniref:Uncharacterized protein n=1 Tax=Linum tenue TaxID=586396 RepID=A0AAV0JE35_9ROSI|nr:unnamed protein product [Linum tenue]
MKTAMATSRPTSCRWCCESWACRRQPRLIGSSR